MSISVLDTLARTASLRKRPLKFAAPSMRDNVANYAENPEGLVRYLMHPTPQHPDEWPAMEITPLTEEQAKMMTAWLLYILKNPDDPGRPK